MNLIIGRILFVAISLALAEFTGARAARCRRREQSHYVLTLRNSNTPTGPVPIAAVVRYADAPAELLGPIAQRRWRFRR
jgi:hypothetical protein